LDHFIAKNATAHKVNSYYILAISYYTFCVGKHTILGPGHFTPWGWGLSRPSASQRAVKNYAIEFLSQLRWIL